MVIEPKVYRIKIIDPKLDDAAELTVVASTIIDAMRHALDVHNGQFADEAIGLECIADAVTLSDDVLFYSPSAKATILYFWGKGESS